MKIRNRLTLISSLTFGVVFTLASAIVYLVFYSSAEKVIYQQLERYGYLTANFFLEEDEMSRAEHQQVRGQFRNDLKGAGVQVYDLSGKIRYGDEAEDLNIDQALLEQIREQQQLNFKVDNYYYNGIFYPDNQGDFIVIVKEINETFISQAQKLLMIFFIVMLVGILVIIAFSRLLSTIAYRPFTDVIHQVNAIEAASLDKPIASTGTRDELEELIDTFNSLLQRLSQAFQIQKNFINYVSHEFKTPLAAISGSLEVFEQKKRSPEEYSKVVSEVLENVYYIEEVLNSLIILSGVQKRQGIQQQFRIDELLFEILEKLISHYPIISPNVQMQLSPEHEYLMNIQGNAYLIQMALLNLLENAFKYSEGKEAVEIHLLEQQGRLTLLIEDHGRGISPEDLKNIMQPFFRGSNVSGIPGSGIGLSLAVLIFKQFDIEIDIHSELDQGTSVSLRFPSF